MVAPLICRVHVSPTHLRIRFLSQFLTVVSQLKVLLLLFRVIL